MNVYKNAAGTWVFFDGEQKHFFDTRQEAQAMSDKLDKAGAVVGVVTMLAGIDDLLDVINAREYGQNQAAAFANDDVATLNVTAADVFNGLNLLSQVKTLLTDGAPTQADYMPVVNRVRSDV